MTFLVFSKEGCPSCNKVQQVLQLAEVKHVIYKVNRDFTREELFEQFPGARTFPQIRIDGNAIGGYTELVAWHDNKQGAVDI